MSIQRAAVTSIFWSALENGSVTVVSFVSLILFAKLLTPVDFGVYSIALAVIEVSGIFTNMFFHDALVRQPNASEEQFNAAFTASIIFGAVCFLLLYALFPLCAAIVRAPELISVGRVMATSLLFSAPAAILSARQSRQFGFKLLALRSLAGRLSGAGIGILVAFYGFGVWSLVVQFLAMTILGGLTLTVFSDWRPRLTTNFSVLSDLLKYSVGSVISLSSSFLTKRTFTFCAGTFLGMEQAGFLNLAFKLIDTVWAISATAVSQVLLPTMAHLQEHPERKLRAYSTAMNLGCIGLFPAFCGLGLVAPRLSRFYSAQNGRPQRSRRFGLDCSFSYSVREYS